MGVYDTIKFDCPNCNAALNVQIKGGDPRMRNFKAKEVPIESAQYVIGDKVH